MTDIPETTDTTEVQDDAAENTEPVDNRVENEEAPEGDDEADTFPREYVEKLRDENAKFRQRAQKSDELAHRLHRALVEADGRLQDPSDLEFTEEHLDDSEALTAALDDLLARKPHLAARKPSGSIGQGAVSQGTGNVDLAGLLRAGAN